MLITQAANFFGGASALVTGIALTLAIAAKGQEMRSWSLLGLIGAALGWAEFFLRPTPPGFAAMLIFTLVASICFALSYSEVKDAP